MQITVYNFKGGVGKTSIALNLALSLDFGIITNDVCSPLDRVLDESQFIKIAPSDQLPTISKEYDIIFDFGGYLDPRVIEAIQKSDWILIPVINDYLNLQVTLDAVNEIKQYNEKIIIIANKTQKNDFEDIKAVIRKFYNNIKIMELKQSKAFVNIFEERKPISEMIKAGGLPAYHYRMVNEQFNRIIGIIDGRSSA